MNDREQKNAYMRMWRANNPEKAAANSKRWRQANTEKLRVANKAYRSENAPSLKLKKAEYVQNNLEKVRASSAESRRKLKRDALRAYGGPNPACSCCGESHEAFLQLDHVDGEGSKHRKTEGMKAGGASYSWLKRNQYPAGFRVLCGNCNSAISTFGTCPHVDPTVSSPSFTAKLRASVVKEYAKGEGCACCHTPHEQFLCVDHIHGRSHSPFPGKGYYLYKWLRDNQFPDGFQALCWNCNFAKRVHGGCPHGSS